LLNLEKRLVRRRDGSPIWIADAQPSPIALTRIDLRGGSDSGRYDEAWLQSLLHNHPEVFPIGQIESGYGDLIPLCRELPLVFGGGRSGALDNLFVTRDGKLVLVEAKLWRNPEARRSVVAQAIEYASAVFQMHYSELESAVAKARSATGMHQASLFEIVAAHSDGIGEDEFFDSLTRNLERGRAIVAVVGDGIREDIMPLARLLQSHAGHRFAFALVELAVYETPVAGARLVIPSVLAQTVLVERGVVRIADEVRQGQRLIVELPLPSSPEAPVDKRMSIGEDEFFEVLGQRYPQLPQALKSFLSKAEALQVYSELKGGLNLKHASKAKNPLNMGTITKGGIVDFGPSTWWGTKTSARAYNEKLATLIDGFVLEVKDGAHCVLRTAGGKMPRLSALLPLHEQEWLNAIQTYIGENLADEFDLGRATQSHAEAINIVPTEVIVQVGTEGGSLTIEGKHYGDKGWQFRMERDERTLLEFAVDGEDFGDGAGFFKQTGYCDSLHVALKSFDRYPYWIEMCVLEVHPAFLDEVLAEVSARGGKPAVAHWLKELDSRAWRSRE
jgi:hypothetical protein